MRELAVTIGGQDIDAPAGIPHGGLPTVATVLGNGITIFLFIGLSLAAVFIVWSGMQWIASGGDKQKIAAARGRLTWTIIGLIVVFLAFAIVNFIGFIFNVNLLKFGA